MRQLERLKAEDARCGRAEILASLAALFRVGDALRAYTLPSRVDAAAAAAAIDLYRAEVGTGMSLARAFGLVGGRGIADATRHDRRAELFWQADARCLSSLTPSVAARRIIAMQNQIERAARNEAPAPPPLDELAVCVRAVLLAGVGIPAFKQLSRILTKGRKQGRENVPGSLVPLPGATEMQEFISPKPGGQEDAGQAHVVGRGGDRRARSNPHPARGAAPGRAADYDGGAPRSARPR